MLGVVEVDLNGPEDLIILMALVGDQYDIFEPRPRATTGLNSRAEARLGRPVPLSLGAHSMPG